MNKYDIRLKATPSIPTIVVAARCLEVGNRYKFFGEKESDLLFVVSMDDVLTMRVEPEN